MCSTILSCSNTTSIKNDSIQYLNIKLSNSQLNKLKSGIKNDTEVTLKISSGVVGDPNDFTSFKAF